MGKVMIFLAREESKFRKEIDRARFFGLVSPHFTPSQEGSHGVVCMCVIAILREGKQIECWLEGREYLWGFKAKMTSLESMEKDRV